MDVDKCRGMMTGMAAGDKNRGPFKMAVCLLQSLVEASASYDPILSLCNYLRWYQARDVGWDDSGPTTAKVIAMFLSEDFADGTVESEKLKDYGERLFHHAATVDVESRGLTSGVNAAHRCPPLALLAPRYSPEELSTAARSESRLTHASEVSQLTCAALVRLLGDLMQGRPWEESVRSVAHTVTSCFPVQNALLEGMDPSCRPYLSRGGYCVDVLKAAVHFVSQSSTFEEALTSSLTFAGQANYAPVIVGALAGALYGQSAVPPTHLRHWAKDDLAAVDRMVNTVAALVAKQGIPTGSTSIAAAGPGGGRRGGH